LGAKVYPVAANPFRFQDAVLVGARESYYGECKFQIDNDTPSYVRMQRERFSALSGKFTPSRGDLVFSKTGELLGVMANKEYCLMLGELSATRSIRLGTNISDQQPALFLSQMYNRVINLPYNCSKFKGRQPATTLLHSQPPQDGDLADKLLQIVPVAPQQATQSRHQLIVRFHRVELGVVHGCANHGS